MKKVLTISIAAYNVEQYIGQTLDSCIVPEIMDKIEVLVENDGSKDNTSVIAKEYEKKYPNTFRVIDKENGGYGSTVNKSMKEATGKYFKLLDGDDWFDKDGLKELVNHLETCDADLVLSSRVDVNEKGEQKHASNKWESLYGELYNKKTVQVADLKKKFVYGMWVTTYRTEMLKKHLFELPLHQLYTDRLYIAYELPYISTISFLCKDVYCYRVGHEGQSVSRENRIRHANDTIVGFELMLDFYQKMSLDKNKNVDFIKLRYSRYYDQVVATILLLPASLKNKKKLIEMERKVRSVSEDLYTECGRRNHMISMFRKYSYSLYWLRKLKKVKNWN